MFLFIYNFVTFVVDGDTDLTMGGVLSYFTGADSIPPLGFDDATLSFNNTNPYPTASTCTLCLTLPTMYQDYASFKEHFIFALCKIGSLVCKSSQAPHAPCREDRPKFYPRVAVRRDSGALECSQIIASTASRCAV